MNVHGVIGVRDNRDGVWVSNGMQAAGYQYVNIDDCWQVSRDAEGTMLPILCDFHPGSKRSPTTFTAKD